MEALPQSRQVAKAQRRRGRRSDCRGHCRFANHLFPLSSSFPFPLRLGVLAPLRERFVAVTLPRRWWLTEAPPVALRPWLPPRRRHLGTDVGGFPGSLQENCQEGALRQQAVVGGEGRVDQAAREACRATGRQDAPGADPSGCCFPGRRTVRATRRSRQRPCWRRRRPAQGRRGRTSPGTVAHPLAGGCAGAELLQGDPYRRSLAHGAADRHGAGSDGRAKLGAGRLELAPGELARADRTPRDCRG